MNVSVFSAHGGLGLPGGDLLQGQAEVPAAPGAAELFLLQQIRNRSAHLWILQQVPRRASRRGVGRGRRAGSGLLLLAMPLRLAPGAAECGLGAPSLQAGSTLFAFPLHRASEARFVRFCYGLFATKTVRTTLLCTYGFTFL
jgi:hypothetical protein